MIAYADDLAGVQAHHLGGFFAGWPKPPSPERHLDLLRGCSHVVVACDGERIVGFYERLGLSRWDAGMAIRNRGAL